jgi:hypothetical protein
MTREWIIPATKNTPEITLQIHEPALVEDNLGLKTWGSAYLLATRLEEIGDKYIKWPETEQRQVLELGSGTGLVGLAAAVVWKCEATLTDLPEIIPNLDGNGIRNEGIIRSLGGEIKVRALDWTIWSKSQVGGKFKVTFHPFNFKISSLTFILR